MRWLVFLLSAFVLLGCGGVRVERKLTTQPAAGPVTEPRRIVVSVGVDGALTYNTPVLHVRQGEKVEITLENMDRAQAHSLVFPDQSAKTRQVMPDERETITFVADKVGEYRYYCDLPGHKDAGEVGRLSVQP